jgi:hypothetical protein
MAYSTSNPPALVSQLLGKAGGSVWIYDSADAATVVRVTGYITNGYDLGMKVGDIVDQIDSAGATVAHRYVVKSVAVDGAADLSDGTAVVVTDTD